MSSFRRVQLLVLALMASATVLGGVAFARQVERCAMVSQPRAERRGCCALAGVDRLTREGGDCCKTLQLADGEDVSQTTVALEVPVAMVALGGAAAVVVEPPRLALTADARARAPPPPLWRPTDTVRLLL